MSYLCISWERRQIQSQMIIFLVLTGIKSQLLHEPKEKKSGFAYQKRHMLNFMDLMTIQLREFALKDLKLLQELQPRTISIKRLQISLIFCKKLTRTTGSWPVVQTLCQTNGKISHQSVLYPLMHTPSLVFFLSKQKMVER